jgi:protein-tyrosine kinase
MAVAVKHLLVMITTQLVRKPKRNQVFFEETMSRIHEALKKAAEDRSSQLTAGVQPDLVDMAAGVLRPVIAETHPAEQVAHDFRGSDGVPYLRFEELVKRWARPKWIPDPLKSVFHNGNNGWLGAERFRTLRSRLYQVASTRPLRRVLVTSSVPAEGKTFVAANLAQSFVRQPDRRVLLIDADLRASSLHQALGAPCTPGLTEYLRGEADEFEVIQKGSDDNLCLIPGGAEVTNPSELLLGDRMKKLLDLVTPVFDWIILDSPPTLAVHDASSLADLCDGVLFVVKAGETDYQLAKKASSEFLKKNLLGVVLNGVEKDAYYGGYYSGYAGHEREDTDRK